MITTGSGALSAPNGRWLVYSQNPAQDNRGGLAFAFKQYDTAFNGAFGNVRRIQEERYGNRLIASDLANPDFMKLADSFGIAHERATSPEALRPALKRAIASNKPALIECPVGEMPNPFSILRFLTPVRPKAAR